MVHLFFNKPTAVYNKFKQKIIFNLYHILLLTHRSLQDNKESKIRLQYKQEDYVIILLFIRRN